MLEFYQALQIRQILLIKKKNIWTNSGSYLPSMNICRKVYDVINFMIEKILLSELSNISICIVLNISFMQRQRINGPINSYNSFSETVL